MQITICGGGNAAHTLAGLMAARQELRVNVYTPFSDEVRQWQQGISAQGGITVITRDGTLTGRPHRVSADPAAVIPGSRLVLLALPAFAHESTLRAIAPHLEDGVWVGVLPARGGVYWGARHALGGRKDRVTIFGLQTLPWACRIQQYGREVTVLGTKAEVDLATYPSHHAGEIITLLNDLLRIRLRPIASFLSLTLADRGQIIHPGIMYGLFHNWDGRPYDEAPLFYQGVTAATAGILQQLSDEVQTVRAVLENRYPELDLTAVQPLSEWLLRSYGDMITDTSSLQSCFVTNRSYVGLRAPMRPAGGGLVPDFQARYLAEDVPYGLVVTRGIAELADVATPVIDRVITWAQARLEKQYLVKGKLQGRDVAASRAPQPYGFEKLDDVIREG
jgi:hypothetical protein